MLVSDVEFDVVKCDRNLLHHANYMSHFCYICALLFYRDKYQIMMVSIMFFLIKTVQYNPHDDTDLVFKDGWRGIPCVFMDLKSCYGCALM